MKKTYLLALWVTLYSTFALLQMPVASAQDSPAASSETTIKAAILNHPRLVLKNGSYFLVLDESGLMPSGTAYGYGLYKDDTRYLSAFNMSLNGKPPVLLSGSTDEGYAGRFVYGNAADQATGAQEQQLMLQREIVISDGVFERITLTNYSNNDVSVDLGIEFESDYADMFEVRGMGRKRRGALTAPVSIAKNGAVISYLGLDNKPMSTRLEFSVTPTEIQKNKIRYHYDLKGQESKVIDLAVDTSLETPFPSESERSYGAAKQKADRLYNEWIANTAQVTTSNTDFNRLIERSVRDIYILRQPTPRGNCLAAGTPWFAVAFGRDQEITSMQTMMFFPQLAKEVIDVLAAYQGTKVDEFTEERPGRIMHELRLGEMARLKEIAFIPYYGTVDATPLWLMLVTRYFDQTGDIEFVRKHWNQIESALQYIEAESPSGYLVYGGKPGAALSNQGWKDSFDSVMYGNGRLAKPPIALCEVQGYFYCALSKMARLAKLLGHKEQSIELADKARKLKEKFLRDFWMEDKRCIALALDGDGKQCDVVSSNIGHLISTGILNEKETTAIADALQQPEMFCDWGVRTLSSAERAYNPMSYHDGSVWPHDNAMAVEGLFRIGRSAHANAIMSGLFKTSKYRSDLRLPELFCGFSSSFSERPVWYPVSCAPQAWAAGSVLQMLAACLGLVPDAAGGALHVNHPALPDWLDNVEVKGIRVGEGSCDLKFQRLNGKTKCVVTSQSGKLKVLIQE